MSVVVRELTLKDESAFYRAVEDWEGEDLSWITFEWRQGMNFGDHLERLHKNRLGVELGPGKVASTMLYGFFKDQIIGRVSIRHELNQYLLERGGHIGYSIAPKHRGLKLSSEMVRKSLDYIRRELALQRILITCSDQNAPSIRIIESLGAKLENSFQDDEAHELVRRYWLTL